MGPDIENLVTERVAAFLGQKSATAHSMLNNAECEGMKNFVTRRGRLRKMWGVTLYAESPLGPGQIRWIDYFNYRWIFQHGASIVVESAAGTAEFFSVGDMLLGAASYVRSARWNNRLYLANGVETKYFENLDINEVLDDRLLTLGLFPPGLGQKIAIYRETGNDADYRQPTVTEIAATGAGLADATLYYYLITYYDSQRQVESLPNGSEVGEDGLWITSHAARRGIFTTGASKAARIDVTLIKALGYDSRVTHFIVYRATQADTSSFKRVNISTDNPNGTPIANNTYDDELAEASLGQILDESLSPPPSGRHYDEGGPNDAPAAYGPKFVKFFRDQIWLFGVNYPGTEYGFELISETTASILGRTVRYFPQTGIAYASGVGEHEYYKFSYDIGRSTGQKDTGIGAFSNTLMFFKESSSYYLDGTNPENYEIREMVTKRGITVSGSLQETTIGVIGIGAEGFTLFDSVAGGKIISEEIADVVEKINLEYADQITSSFDPDEEKYECHCPIENTHNTLVFVYDCKLLTWSFTKRAGGAQAYGLTANKRIVGLLGDKLNGRLYTSTNRASVTFNGETMHGTWRSKQFDFANPGKLKSLQMVTIVARAKRDFRVSIDVIPDFAQNDSVSVNDVDPDVRGDVLAEDADDADGMIWNEGQWSNGSEKKEFNILIQAIGKKLQLIVRNSDTDADRANFEIEEIILWASLLDGEDAR